MVWVDGVVVQGLGNRGGGLVGWWVGLVVLLGNGLVRRRNLMVMMVMGNGEWGMGNDGDWFQG